MSHNLVSPRNTGRAYLINPVVGNMASDILSSNVADFREMVIGSVQAVWDGNNAVDGTIIVEGSNLPEGPFDEVCGSEIDLNTSRKTRLWNLGIIGYRYVRVVYKKGSNTQGTLSAFAIGKISK